jgi:hypothetical protein
MLIKTRLATLAAVGLLIASTGYARKIAPVGALCPDGARRQIDAAGKKDLCVSTVAPTCPEGSALQVDHAGENDACRAGERTTTPACGKGRKLSVRAAEDVCEQAVRPECPRGFHYKSLPAEDKCVP